MTPNQSDSLDITIAEPMNDVLSPAFVSKMDDYYRADYPDPNYKRKVFNSKLINRTWNPK